MADEVQPALDYSFLPATDATISRPKTSVLYSIGLLLVTFAMVLLPLIYLALVGYAGYCVYYFAVHCFPDFGRYGSYSSRLGGYGSYRGGRWLIGALILYIIVLFIGVVILFFMVKPLFARRSKLAQPLALNPAVEPLLYAFIERICAIVGAPSPKRIDLDCDLNASASFRRGIFGMSRNDMVLTIGLPLVANLTVQEFGGVVAHEFGHFTQAVGLRLTYVVGVINRWFLRVAYERDAWDVALERWSFEVEDGWVGMVVWTAQIGVWFSRLILKTLMFVGFGIGGFMLRQMEYNADSYEIKVSGSTGFESTTQKFATLAAALELTHKHLEKTWKKYRTLPDNLPELLRQQHERMPAHVIQQINDTLGLGRTGFFASHPSPGDRIRAARKAEDPGIFHDDRPASALFGSFEHPARFVTMLHYTDDIGIPITPEMLTPVQVERPAAAAIQVTHATSDNPLDRYFFGLLPLIQPIRLNAPVPSGNVGADLAELQQLSAGLGQIAEQLAVLRRDYDEASGLLNRARAAINLLVSGAPVDPARFGKEECSVASATAAEKETQQTRERLRASLNEITPALKRRFELGLSVALANQPDDPSSPAVDDVVAGLNYEAEVFERHQELLDAIKVLDEIDAIAVTWQGSAPVVRARGKQMQTVLMLHEQLNPVAAPAPVAQKTGLRIQGSTRPSGPSSEQDLEDAKRKAHEWMAGYEQRLGYVVQRAVAIETAQA